MSRATPLEELLLQLVELLRDRLGAEVAEVWTGAGGSLRRAAVVPHADPPRPALIVRDERVVVSVDVRGTAWTEVWLPELIEGRDGLEVRVAPASNGGELFGLVVVAREREFSRHEDQTLGELGRLVGVALHNLRLDSALESTLDELRGKAADLQRSRARLVEASDAARRSIERDLHDGAQQSLLALVLKVRAALEALLASPTRVDAATELLEELEADIDTVSSELRRLARGVYPPELHSGGLAEALPNWGRSAVPVEVSVPRLRLAPTVEAAVYFCCLEAVQNIAKHAGPEATARVVVDVDADVVHFEVADDGAGFDPARSHRGTGLANIVDRVGALGGEAHIASTPGAGTIIRGSVPLPHLECRDT